MPSRPSKPWRVALSGAHGHISETDYTSQSKAYEHLRHELAESNGPATKARVMQWADGRWGHFETVYAADLLIDKPKPSSVFVAVWNGRPIAAGPDLDAVKAAAVARESQYLSAPPEYRWDAEPGDESWQLMQFSARTRRWSRTSTLVFAVSTVDTPTA